jgi:hypothetical protein
MQSKLMSNPEQPSGADDSIAKISGDTVEIFGQRFPLRRQHYFKPTGELKSFVIDPTAIKYNGREIPIGGRIILYEDGKFHGAGIYGKYTYEHKGQFFKLSGGSGIFFYPNTNLERFTVENETQTEFTLESNKLLLHKWDTVTFYEKSGLPKTIWLNLPRSAFPPPIKNISEDYNVLEVSETGKITDRIYEERPDYDYD